MNEIQTDTEQLDATLVAYADGVYNLELWDPDTGKQRAIEIDKDDAERYCELLGVACPEPEPTAPEQWG